MSDTLYAIGKLDKRGQQQVDALLLRSGIRRDANLDYTCGLFDDDDNLIATGSCFGNTLRCLAVDSAHQGEGLLNTVISHLIEKQVERGRTHLFVYTKESTCRPFLDLGFHEIARVDGRLVFLENQRSGFRNYCRNLAANRPEGKHIGGIVMNANPFTLGHRYLIEQALKECDVLHVFVLSEEAGPIPFAVRRRLVAQGVADLPGVIVHDSGQYIISSATFPSYFLKDEDSVIRTHASLDIAIFAQIAKALGITHRYAGEEPFSHVTALYNEVMAAQLPNAGVDVHILPRLAIGGSYVSASAVRKAIHDGTLSSIENLLPAATRSFFESDEAAPVRRALQNATDVVHY